MQIDYHRPQMERKRSHLMLNEIKSEINSDNGFDTKSEVIILTFTLNPYSFLISLHSQATTS